MSVVKLKPAVISPAEAALAELHARRRALFDGMSDVGAKIAKVQAASSQELGDARAALAALDAKERAAVSKWADAGADGAPPAVDAEARAALNQRLVAAEASAAASAAAVSALTAKHNELARQANALAPPISAAAVAVMVDRHEAQTAEAKDLIQRLTPLMASLDGRRQAIVAEVNSEGPNHAGHFYFDHMRRLEQISDTRQLMRGDPQPNVAYRFAAELEALKRGDQ